MGCADSLESQEFPIIIPLPFQQPGGRKHKYRTTGPSLWPGQRQKHQGWACPGTRGQAKLSARAGMWVPMIQSRKLWFRTFRRAQGSYLLQLSTDQGLNLADPRLLGPPRKVKTHAQPKSKYPSKSTVHPASDHRFPPYTNPLLQEVLLQKLEL